MFQVVLFNIMLSKKGCVLTVIKIWCHFPHIHNGMDPLKLHRVTLCLTCSEWYCFQIQTLYNKVATRPAVTYRTFVLLEARGAVVVEALLCKLESRGIDFRLCHWNFCLHNPSGRPGSSVSIATGYGLDGPGIESRWGEIFHNCPDRP
jgi:hypothetical protein